MDKVKLKDLLAFVDYSNNKRDLQFGILNKDKTRFKVLSTGKIYNVSEGLQRIVWEDPYSDRNITSLGIYIRDEQNKKTVVFPLIARSFSTNIEYDQIMDVCTYYFHYDESRKREIANILWRVYGCDSRYEDGHELPFRDPYLFVNDNRYKISDIDRILKIEKAIERTADKKKIEKPKQTLTPEDENDLLRTTEF